MHGGMIAAIIDIKACFEVQKHVSTPAPAIHLTIDCLRAARKKDLYIAAKTIKLDRTVRAIDVTVANEQQSVIAAGRGRFNIKQS